MFWLRLQKFRKQFEKMKGLISKLNAHDLTRRLGQGPANYGARDSNSLSGSRPSSHWLANLQNPGYIIIRIEDQNFWLLTLVT